MLLCNSVAFTLEGFVYCLGWVLQYRSEIGYWYSDLLVGSLDRGFEREIPGFIVVQAVCREGETNDGGQRAWCRDRRHIDRL